MSGGGMGGRVKSSALAGVSVLGLGNGWPHNGSGGTGTNGNPGDVTASTINVKTHHPLPNPTSVHFLFLYFSIKAKGDGVQDERSLSHLSVSNCLLFCVSEVLAAWVITGGIPVISFQDQHGH